MNLTSSGEHIRDISLEVTQPKYGSPLFDSLWARSSSEVDLRESDTRVEAKEANPKADRRRCCSGGKWK